MMTEELPPLPVTSQLTASPSCSLTITADDNRSCPLKAVGSNGSARSEQHDRKYGHQRSQDLGKTDSCYDYDSPGLQYPSNGNPHNKALLRTESCPTGSNASSLGTQKSKYRGDPDGEAPILYDYESTSQFPNSNRCVFSPTRNNSQKNDDTQSKSILDDYPNDGDDTDKSENLCNGDVVFISEDVKAEARRTPTNVRSYSVKQRAEARDGETTRDRHPPVARANSEPITSGIVASSSRGNLDLVKLALLDQHMLQSPMTRAIFQGDHAHMLECIREGENPCVVCSSSGCTFFHLVAQASTSDRELSWVPMVFLLSNAGLDPNVKNKDGTTPVGIAITRKLVQIVAALLKCGAEVNGEDMFQAEQIRGVVKSEMMETIRRLTPSYWSAVHDLTPFKVNRLVKAWARVNVSRYGKTLIEYAKENARDLAIVKLLHQNEASIELAHAVMAGDRDRVKVLLCDGAVDLNTSDTSVKNNYFEPFAPLTLYGAAVKLGHIGVLNELKAAQSRMRTSVTSASYSGSSMGVRGSTYGGSVPKMKDTAVVFYKGSSNEEICEIRNTSKPVTSTLCSIV